MPTADLPKPWSRNTFTRSQVHVDQGLLTPRSVKLQQSLPEMLAACLAGSFDVHVVISGFQLLSRPVLHWNCGLRSSSTGVPQVDGELAQLCGGSHVGCQSDELQMPFPWKLSRLCHSGVKLRNQFLRNLGTRLCAGQQFLVILSVWRGLVQHARGLRSACRLRA